MDKELEEKFEEFIEAIDEHCGDISVYHDNFESMVLTGNASSKKNYINSLKKWLKGYDAENNKLIFDISDDVKLLFDTPDDSVLYITMKKKLNKKDIVLQEMLGIFNEELKHYFKKESRVNKEFIETYFNDAKKKWDKKERELIIYNLVDHIPNEKISCLSAALSYIGKNCGFSILHVSQYRDSSDKSGVSYHYY